MGFLELQQLSESGTKMLVILEAQPGAMSGSVCGRLLLRYILASLCILA